MQLYHAQGRLSDACEVTTDHLLIYVFALASEDIVCSGPYHLESETGIFLDLSLLNSLLSKYDSRSPLYM